MKIIFYYILKGILWLALSITVSILSIFIGMQAFGWSEHPLGKGLFIYATFSKSTSYDVFLTEESRLDYIVPTTYTNAYDSVSGRRKESVQRIIRYPDHLAITVVNNLDGSKKYYILNKDFESKNISAEDILATHLFESRDSNTYTIDRYERNGF